MANCKRFKLSTHSDRDEAIAPNLLQQHFATEYPNQTWLSDITYILKREGWQYFAGIKDLYGREIVGYVTSSCIISVL